MRPMLERIYRDHRQGLFTLALSITRNAERAEDAVHTAFARMCRRLTDGDGVGGNGRLETVGDPVAYVHAAVRNAAIDQLRGDSSVVVSPQSIFAEAGDEADPVVAVCDKERDRLIRRAVEDLPDDQRQVVVMKVFGGLTFRQIAEVFGEPLATITSRHRRALKALRQRIETLV